MVLAVVALGLEMSLVVLHESPGLNKESKDGVSNSSRAEARLVNGWPSDAQRWATWSHAFRDFGHFFFSSDIAGMQTLGPEASLAPPVMSKSG